MPGPEVVRPDEVARERGPQRLELLVHVAPQEALVGLAPRRAAQGQLAIELAHPRRRERALGCDQALRAAQPQRDRAVRLCLPVRRVDITRAAVRTLTQLERARL